MRWRIALAIAAVGFGSVVARAQFQFQGAGVGAPGGSGSILQFNTNGMFGGITGVTSDNAGNVGFATSSSLFLYGIVSGNCLKVGANNQIADAGTTCGGSGSPGGVNTQVQFNTNGAFGGISGATSNGSNISFTTNNLVINGQAISKVSGTTGTLATVTGALSTNCIKADGSGNLVDSGTTCGGGGGGSTTSIAAGTNITTSGVATNTTVNVIATPSFTTVIATGNLTATTAQITGWLTAPGVNLFTATIANNLTGSTANFSSNLTAQIAQFPGFLSAGGASLSGLAVATATYSGNLTGTTANFSSNLTAGTAQFTGLVTGTSAVFQTVTVNNLTPTGPNCLQETGGVLQATNSACATATPATSIAAGTNITTSGTSSNVTVNVVATPSFTTVIASGNLTASTAQFSGFLTAGGASLSGLNLQTATITGVTTYSLGTITTTNSTAVSIAATWSNSTTTFAAPLFINVTTNTSSANTTSGFGVGSRLVDIQATSLSVLSISPSGAMSSAALQSAATQCLQASGGGLIFGTAVPCATQTSTPSIAAGTNITTSGTAANTTVNMVPTTPEFGVQINHAGVLTADSGFTYFSGIATHTLGLGSNLTTTNSRALSIIGTLSSGTVQFGAPLFMNITTNAFASGTKLVDIQGSGISYFSVFASTGITVLGNITGTQAQFTGWLTGPGANFQSATIGGALIGSTGNFSSNLTASTVMGVVGWLTAPGVNMQTATLAGALIGTSGNFSTNLTGNIAQFAGFMSAGGASLSGLTIQTETLTSNLTGTTANFSSNLTANIAQFAGFLSAGGASISGASLTTATVSQITATSAFVTSVIGNAGTNSAGSISFLTNNVAQLGDGGLNANGWYNWTGEGRLSADSQGFISTGFVNLITVNNLKAGRTYKFVAEAPLKGATAATGGISFRIGGGAAATNVVYDGWFLDSGAAGTGTIKGYTQATALSTTVGSATLSGTTGHATIIGTISVSGAGTLILQAAGFSTVTAASAVTVSRGTTFILEDMP